MSDREKRNLEAKQFLATLLPYAIVPLIGWALDKVRLVRQSLALAIAVIIAVLMSIAVGHSNKTTRRWCWIVALSSVVLTAALLYGMHMKSRGP